MWVNIQYMIAMGIAAYIVFFFWKLTMTYDKQSFRFQGLTLNTRMNWYLTTRKKLTTAVSAHQTNHTSIGGTLLKPATTSKKIMTFLTLYPTQYQGPRCQSPDIFTSQCLNKTWCHLFRVAKIQLLQEGPRGSCGTMVIVTTQPPRCTRSFCCSLFFVLCCCCCCCCCCCWSEPPEICRIWYSSSRLEPCGFNS